MGGERWVPVLDYEGLYEVSSMGRIRSLDRKHPNGGLIRGRDMATNPRKDGYVPVTIWKRGERTVRLMHRVVLDSFVCRRPEGAEGMHADNNRANNALSNLSWGTRSDNIADQLRHGTHGNASKTHCPSGHPYDDENTYHVPGIKPHRTCRRCTYERNREIREKKQAERKSA